jgi:hypothetical protein
MLTWLRSRRNRFHQRAVLAITLGMWLAFLVSATCTLPGMTKAMPELMPACQEQVGHPGHTDSLPKVHQACSLKPCLESQPQPSFPPGPRNGEPTALALLAVLIFCSWRGLGPLARLPRLSDPPTGRRIPLIYRFCALLN